MQPNKRVVSDKGVSPYSEEDDDDDVNTSFEIDEPDEEEVHVKSKVDITTQTSTTSSLENKQTADSRGLGDEEDGEEKTEQKLQQLRHQHQQVVDPGEQTDSSVDRSTNSSTSTPTTADVADVESVALSPAYGPTMHGATSRFITRPPAISPSSPLRRIPKSDKTIDGDNVSSSITITTTVTMTTNDTERDNVNAMSMRLDHQQQPSGAANGNPAAAVAASFPDAACLRPLAPTGRNHRRQPSAASYISVRSLENVRGAPSGAKACCFEWLRWASELFKTTGVGEPSVHHVLVVIFLEFFSWGLLMTPILVILQSTFPHHTLLMNGIVMGIKGILSFLSAPLIGALSDIWGRKFFLLITVFFTCLPIPMMTINPWWFFAMVSISGIFAVTFSVVFAYVADVTSVEDRSRGYGLASATFAASLVVSPALGYALMDMYGVVLVVALGSAIAVLNVFFILVAVPESLPEKLRPTSWGAGLNWEQADPFAGVRKVTSDKTILLLCLMVLLSYLPESGQYSCMFAYLQLKMNFTFMEVAIFIAMIGLLSIAAQVTLGAFISLFGVKRTIIIGLVLELIQLIWYAFGTQKWMMWAAGVIAASNTITYPAISSFVSLQSSPESQGAVQGMITGMRGLCNGLGPAMFGIVFYLFNVDIENNKKRDEGMSQDSWFNRNVPGPPFLIGAVGVFLAIVVAMFIPDIQQPSAYDKKRVSIDVQYEIESGHKAAGSLAPLIRADSLAQL